MGERFKMQFRILSVSNNKDGEQVITYTTQGKLFSYTNLPDEHETFDEIYEYLQTFTDYPSRKNKKQEKGYLDD